MKVAVTGAGGFIGQHVLADLVGRGVETIAVDRSTERLEAWKSRVRIVEMDIGDTEKEAFEQCGRPDVLIHLAWAGLPNYKSRHHFETELPKQYSFIQRMLTSGLKTLVVTGTCFEYGMQSGSLSESLLPRPANPYGFAKDALRRQIEFLRGEYSFAFSWARLFYLYGEGQAETSILPLLRRAIEKGEKVFNMSGGEQLRDYLPITKVAQFLCDLAVRGSNAGLVNICSGEPISVRRLVENAMKEHNWEIRLNLGYYPYPDYEPMAFWGDPSHLLETLGKNPRIVT
ncbi:MAG: NAD(P)-dependent oxidoreductase [Candidatus Ozemobacteraceae bacterium]